MKKRKPTRAELEARIAELEEALRACVRETMDGFSKVPEIARKAGVTCDS